ncbi:MAG: dihydroorotate dehydrogenase [Dehalococcoidia bacterium]|nr:dihydroorotate dehydrogenase [Dehalococcoidia bacterium]
MTNPISLEVDLAPGAKRSLILPNPVMVASGTFGYGIEYTKVFDIQRLGGIVTKTTTLAPRRGNPPVRIAETPAGMLNSIGLQNIGITALVRDLAPVYATWKTPVVASIMGFTVGEYAEVASRLEGIEGFAGVELNLSCPNTERGGVEFGQDSEAAAEAVARVSRATTLPIIAKLTPNIADPRIVARAVVEAGADALCVGNTLQAMAMDLERRRPVIGATFAGLSGPALKPVALRQVYVVAGAVDVPVIGCGGIATARDALEFILAGASAVQIGTATFTNPLAPIEAIDGIEAYCREHEICRIGELVGAGRAPADRKPRPETVPLK